MSEQVKMPQMGESITEGTITTWLKKVGDTVAKDEALFEISTDKVDAEIPSPASGVLLEIKVAAGQVVPIHTVVAVIGASATDTIPSPSIVKEAAPPEAPQHVPATQEEGRHVKSSPLVRKMAREHDVDLQALHGTGMQGRITKNDMLSHLEGGASAPAPVPAPAPAAPSAPQHTTIPDAYLPKVHAGDKREDLSPMRAKIAEHMVLSKRISPHVSTVWEIDFSHVVNLRARHKAVWEERYGVPLTYTSFIMKATVDALKAYPVLNASLDSSASPQKVIYHKDINLGLAVSLDWGLLVPVIHGAQDLNLLGLAKRAVDLANRARSKKLKSEEVQLGTFTITNPGNYGAMFNIPVINQPQVAILGVGTVEKRPVVIDDMLAIRTRAYLTLSFDHRLIDGAVADQFMLRIKKGIESFEANDL